MHTPTCAQVSVLALAAAALLTGPGCVTAWRAKASLYDAFYAHQARDNAAALAKVQQAVRRCEWPGVPGHVIIETYDDAGLYYYLNDRPRESCIHQAVAVLLADVIPTPDHLRGLYFDRLLKALAASAIDLDPAAVAADHRLLLGIPEVRDNPRVRRHYGHLAGPR